MNNTQPKEQEIQRLDEIFDQAYAAGKNPEVQQAVRKAYVAGLRDQFFGDAVDRFGPLLMVLRFLQMAACNWLTWILLLILISTIVTTEDKGNGRRKPAKTSRNGTTQVVPTNTP